MLEQYMNKKCRITIAFALYTSSGSAPIKIVGEMVNADKEFVEIKYDANDKNTPLSFKNAAGSMLVKRDYIINIVEL